jgi:hypothetical protein
VDPVESKHSWPDLDANGEWATEAMEEILRDTTQTPEELLERARQLRAEAATTDVDGYRSANLTLAGRYEEAAAARLAST